MFKPYEYSFDTWEDWELDELEKLGEYFAAGFLAGGKDRPIILRHAHGFKKSIIKHSLPVYEGTRLYPEGEQYLGDFLYSLFFRSFSLQSYENGFKLNDKQVNVIGKLEHLSKLYPHIRSGIHSMPNFERFLKEGLPGYLERINRTYERVKGWKEKEDFLQSLRIVHEGICIFVERIILYLKEVELDGEEKQKNRDILVKSYQRILQGPARTFEEAITAVNFLFCLTGRDGFGRFDQYMGEFYEKSRSDGQITEDAAIEWLKELWSAQHQYVGLSLTLGGSKSDGSSAYNDITILTMKAGKGKRLPNINLRLRKDAPEEIWDQALESISSGCGTPALYCEENFLKALEESRLSIFKEDIYNYAFCGCTETMIHGCSAVGSVDEYLNTLKVLEETLNKDMENCSTFPQFLECYKNRLREAVSVVVSYINRGQEVTAKYSPYLIRSMFCDDCIDVAREYHSGGARYNWGMISVAGLTNAIDSLMAVKEIVYERKEMSAFTLLDKLANNFRDDPDFQKRLVLLPKFGNDHKETDDLAYEISSFVFNELGRYTYWRGGKVTASIILWVTFTDHGRNIGATPDGRPAGAPLCDSAGAAPGRDKKGPTALLRSVTRLDLIHAVGTPVVNVRFTKKMFSDPESRAKIKSLIRTYFKMGGMQLQITVVDQEVLKDAIEHPENYNDLIIRIGGHSEYFNNLEPDLKLAVLERTVHEA